VREHEETNPRVINGAPPLNLPWPGSLSNQHGASFGDGPINNNSYDDARIKVCGHLHAPDNFILLHET
jgi:hypothetical protein